MCLFRIQTTDDHLQNLQLVKIHEVNHQRKSADWDWIWTRFPGGCPYRLVWRRLFPAWNDPPKTLKSINFSFVTSWHPHFWAIFAFKFSRYWVPIPRSVENLWATPPKLSEWILKMMDRLERGHRLYNNGHFWYQFVKFLRFFLSMKGGRIDFHHSSNVSKQSTGEANNHASPQQSWAFTNSHFKKQNGTFSQAFRFGRFPNFSQVKLQSAIPLVPTRFFLPPKQHWY